MVEKIVYEGQINHLPAILTEPPGGGGIALQPLQTTDHMEGYHPLKDGGCSCCIRRGNLNLFFARFEHLNLHPIFRKGQKTEEPRIKGHIFEL